MRINLSDLNVTLTSET